MRVLEASFAFVGFRERRRRLTTACLSNRHTPLVRYEIWWLTDEANARKSSVSRDYHKAIHSFWNEHRRCHKQKTIVLLRVMTFSFFRPCNNRIPIKNEAGSACHIPSNNVPIFLPLHYINEAFQEGQNKGKRRKTLLVVCIRASNHVASLYALTKSGRKSKKRPRKRINRHGRKSFVKTPLQARLSLGSKNNFCSLFAGRKLKRENNTARHLTISLPPSMNN